jgi:hypothetical protein
MPWAVTYLRRAMNALLQRVGSFLSRTAPVWSTALLLTVLVAGIFASAYEAAHERAVSFDGIVERKVRSPKGSYFLIVRQRNGDEIRFRVEPWTYDRARVGMPAHKAAGEQWPQIGEAAHSLTIGNGLHEWLRSRLSSLSEGFIWSAALLLMA